MDIVEMISEKSTSVALALVVMYFYNKLVVDFLQERKEIIEALRAERKEWLSMSDHYINHIFGLSTTMTEAITDLRSQIHNLRNDLTKFMLRFDKGGTNDSG